RSHTSSTWTSGCSSWSPVACSPPCRYGGLPARTLLPSPRVPGDMQVAVVTSCHHFFHGACLRKWLYVQDSCPMCHQREWRGRGIRDRGMDVGTEGWM
uniref:Zinc finger RING-H2-type domain-containing protein n=1 Tax=Meleagris gallopavo TaxID=9103 RepID=A0A803Y0L5_MELGA